MPTSTNFAWVIPDVGASVNTWGTLLNTILTDIDSKMVTATHIVAERSASRALTNLTGLTVVSGGASITGNSSVTGGTLSVTDSNNNSTYQLVLSGLAGTSKTYLGTFGGNGASYLSSNAKYVGGWSIDNSAWGTASVVLSTPAGDGTIAFNIGAINTFPSTVALVSSTGLAVSGDVLPEANGTRALGSTSLRWSQVWCTAGAFNTSDATLKTPLRAMQAQELAAGFQMSQELGTFQWLDSVKEKGDKARRHVGLTVQRAAEIMESHGLKPWSYGFMGFDKWAAVTEIVDATEADDGAYQEEVTRQKTEKQTNQNLTVEIINGKPTLKIKTIETDVPVTEQIQVVDADGKPVFIDVPEVPAVLDEDGNVVTPAVPAHQVPMLHAVPVMETVKVWKRVKEVRPAGESYAFRSDQLAFFIAAGVAAKARA